MRDQTHGGELLLVVFEPLAWKPEEYVPVHMNAIVTSPLQQTDVTDACGPFLHELQDVCVQAFDARLEVTDPPSIELPELILREVGLCLVEEGVIQTALGQWLEDTLNVVEIEDVVDSEKLIDRIAFRQLVDATQGAGGRL